MAEEDWMLKPRLGLGDLAFGQSLREFESDQRGFGPVETKVDRGGTFSVDRMSETEISELIEVLGDDGAKEVLDSMRQADGNMSGLVDIFLPNGLRVSFQNGELSAFQADWNASRLHYQGHNFFGTDPLTALLALQDSNGEAPVVEGDSMWFSQLRVHIIGFLEKNASSLLQRRELDHEQGVERVVAWGAEVMIGGYSER